MNHTIYYRSEYLEIIRLKNKFITYKEHNHVSVYIIGLIVEGSVTLKCDEQIAIFSPNSFFVIKPYQIHALLLPENYTMLSLCIHKDLVAKYESNTLYNMLTDLLSQLPLTINHTLLANAVEALYHCEPFQPLDSNILSSAYILCQNPENNICVQSMADNIFFSKYHYIKRFKQNIGMTPHKFQIQNKVRRAQRLIEDGEPLTAIATDLGFYDQSHFIKCFKNIIGITPSEYKQSFKRLHNRH
ncbi:AraC family transcriptional regulator [Konateibacter massiliensis]|uniref:AraC family transcriptional regulator n=1 Tax=Konateibacter massiliensis TaxID=2002841 RepID=UPI000C14C9BA|nr:AraC family transcriptional regulator [Konateibacter massiliensis]